MAKKRTVNDATTDSEGLRNLGKALKALTYNEMMLASDMFVQLLQTNNGPIVKDTTMAATFDDFLDRLCDGLPRRKGNARHVAAGQAGRIAA